MYDKVQLNNLLRKRIIYSHINKTPFNFTIALYVVLYRIFIIAVKTSQNAE
jgi:hypothetical protein